jgi:hypothetical protein
MVITKKHNVINYFLDQGILMYYIIKIVNMLKELKMVMILEFKKGI